MAQVLSSFVNNPDMDTQLQAVSKIRAPTKKTTPTYPRVYSKMVAGNITTRYGIIWIFVRRTPFTTGSTL